MMNQANPDQIYELNQSYSTRLSIRNIEQTRQALVQLGGPIIVDKVVHDIYFKAMHIPPSSNILILPAGEKYKNQNTVKRIHAFLLQQELTREQEVIVLGGGTITDVAAYAVSTFKRGCGLVLIPTTLLGMVDAALGGKTAVNDGKIKNLTGTFYPAQDIMIVPEFLITCTFDNLLNGLAEMIKLWHIVPHLNLPHPSAIAKLSGAEIAEFARAKLAICSRDPRDIAERRLLNLGHTFAHLIEAMHGFKITHGKAVAMGIVMAAKFSNQLGFINHVITQQIEENISSLGFETRLDKPGKKRFIDYFQLHASTDKKADETGLVLVLFRNYREVFVSDSIPVSQVMTLLPACL